MLAFLIFALLFFILQLPMQQPARTVTAAIGVAIFAVFLILQFVGVGVIR